MYTDDETLESSEVIKEEEKPKTKLEPLNRKRGPKKRIVRRLKNVTFKLDNDVDFVSSDTTSSSSDDDIDNSHTKSTLNKPWTEKYRPTDIEDLLLDESTSNKVKKIINDKTMPNIIITGFSGIGKTTTILCIAKNLLGKYFNEGVLEMNASDNRGVQDIEERVEYFCKKKLEINDNLAKHKIVLLDEADNLTKRAQRVINNLMEQHYSTTRFAYTCNDSNGIIEAIQSRCILFKYQKLTSDQIIVRLSKICEMENVPYTKEGLYEISMIAQGDLRKSINNLQLVFNGYKDIIPENVFKLCDKPHPMIIQNIFIACSKKDIKSALEILSNLYKNGYSSTDISSEMINTLKNIDKNIINEKIKVLYMEEISQACLVISKGISTNLQLDGSIAALCRY